MKFEIDVRFFSDVKGQTNKNKSTLKEKVFWQHEKKYVSFLYLY